MVIFKTSIPFEGMVGNDLMLTLLHILKEMNINEYLTLHFKSALDKSRSSVFDTLLLSEIYTNEWMLAPNEVHIIKYCETTVVDSAGG
jgi:hypothetical protein